MPPSSKRDRAACDLVKLASPFGKRYICHVPLSRAAAAIRMLLPPTYIRARRPHAEDTYPRMLYIIIMHSRVPRGLYNINAFGIHGILAVIIIIYHHHHCVRRASHIYTVRRSRRIFFAQPFQLYPRFIIYIFVFFSLFLGVDVV